MAKRHKKAPKVNTVDSIFKECAKEVIKGIGKKRVSKAARKYWVDNAKISIAAQFAKGDTWDKDKKNTLPVALKMGKIAAILANGQIILQWAAEAAALAVQEDPRCPNGGGGGGYCDF